MAEYNEKTDTETRKALKELSEVHPKVFEKQFREWMERDGVARSLQAKLRCDLIANFNSTQLGKLICLTNILDFFFQSQFVQKYVNAKKISVSMGFYDDG